jgi:hypothetical protein
MGLEADRGPRVRRADLPLCSGYGAAYRVKEVGQCQ